MYYMWERLYINTAQLWWLNITNDKLYTHNMMLKYDISIKTLTVAYL
jgi:hypothetical protein